MFVCLFVCLFVPLFVNIFQPSSSFVLVYLFLLLNLSSAEKSFCVFFAAELGRACPRCLFVFVYFCS